MNHFFINKGTMEHVKNNQYVISLSWIDSEFGSGSVVGYLTNEFQIRTDAKYEPIFNVDGFLESSQKFAGVNGRGLANTGFWSQLYYKNGGFIILTPEFRIVDWGGEDESPTLKAAETLTQLCLPSGGVGLFPTDKVAQAFSSKIDAVKNAFDSDSRTRHQAMETLRSTYSFENLFGTVKDAAIKGVNFIGDLNLSDVSSKNPPAINVKIGEFFDSSRMEMGFFVEAVDCKFSKEMTARGPLYVDVKLELKTQARPTTSGLKAQGISRVKLIDSENKPVITGFDAQNQIKSYANRLNSEAGLR